jgi:hypothetical protein
MRNSAGGEAATGHVWVGHEGYLAIQTSLGHAILGPIRNSSYFSICFCKVTDDTSRVDGRRRAADEFNGKF